MNFFEYSGHSVYGLKIAGWKLYFVASAQHIFPAHPMIQDRFRGSVFDYKWATRVNNHVHKRGAINDRKIDFILTELFGFQNRLKTKITISPKNEPS